ncbi:30S ribosomal protein S10, partial [Ferroplasma acidiphilum]
MAYKARISLSGTENQIVDVVCNEIKAIAKRTGVEIHGPIPLPTKKLKVP